MMFAAFVNTYRYPIFLVLILQNWIIVVSNNSPHGRKGKIKSKIEIPKYTLKYYKKTNKINL